MDIFSGFALRRQLAVLLGVAVVGAVIMLAMIGRPGPGGWSLLPNFGFGANWQCTWPGKGDPLCVKETNPAAR